MNTDKIIAALPDMPRAERDRLRANAESLRDSGTPDQRVAATKVLEAMEAVETAEHDAIVERLSGMEVSARVVEAFRVNPMTETEAKIIQVLLDHPGSTSKELSKALGWRAQTWHMHFGTMCSNRSLHLWPAPRAEARDADFYSGILADLSTDNRWTMKPDVAAAFAEIGLRPRN